MGVYRCRPTHNYVHILLLFVDYIIARYASIWWQVKYTWTRKPGVGPKKIFIRSIHLVSTVTIMEHTHAMERMELSTGNTWGPISITRQGLFVCSYGNWNLVPGSHVIARIITILNPCCIKWWWLSKDMNWSRQCGGNTVHKQIKWSLNHSWM